MRRLEDKDTIRPGDLWKQAAWGHPGFPVSQSEFSVGMSVAEARARYSTAYPELATLEWYRSDSLRERLVWLVWSFTPPVARSRPEHPDHPAIRNERTDRWLPLRKVSVADLRILKTRLGGED